MKKTIIIGKLIALTLVVLLACNKNKEYDLITPPDQSTFTNQTTGTFFITNVPNASFKVPIGVTTVSDVDRKVTVSITSPTGAVAGTQYTAPTTTVTIPAGKTVDSLTIGGIFSGYSSSSRVDTLVIKIIGGDVAPSDYNNTYRLILRKYCNVDLNAFLGTYTRAFDIASTTYGPYTMRIDSAVSTGATSGYLKVRNLWDTGDPALIRINLDWSNPANFTTTVVDGQFLYTDATYGTARVRPVGTGTFSACDNTFRFSYQVYVAAGNFAATNTTLAR